MAKKRMKLNGMAIALIVLGLLVLGNFYWDVVNWAIFIGGAILIAGIIKLFMKHKRI